MTYLKVLLSLLIIFLNNSFDCEAQRRPGRFRTNGPSSRNSKIRHVANMKFFDGYFGITGKGLVGKTGVGIFIDDGKATSFKVRYGHFTLPDINVRRYGSEMSYKHTIYSLGSTLFIAGSAGAILNYETLTRNEEFNIRNQFNYGGFIGLDSEVFIKGPISSYVEFNQYFLARRNLSRYRQSFGVGIRFNFK